MAHGPYSRFTTKMHFQNKINRNLLIEGTQMDFRKLLLVCLIKKILNLDIYYPNFLKS